MIRILTTTALAVVCSAMSAKAADLPSHKAPPPAPPMISWTGAYAGLNAGYGFGTNNNTFSQNNGIGWQETDESSPYINAGGPLAMNGYGANSQSGFIGGAQFGYNYQWGKNFVVGLETDIQGAGIRGNSKTNGAASFNGYDEDATSNSKSVGGTSVQAGVDYLGTVRGRLGYLFTPTLLGYGTAGFTYGGVYANVSQAANEALYYNNGSFAVGTSNNGWNGSGSQNQILTGWNAGGGVEWMFMTNWSLKAEAIYWNLGNMQVSTSSMGVSGMPAEVFNTIGWGRTSVNYQGVIARAGINYHFDFVSAPVVAKF